MKFKGSGSRSNSGPEVSLDVILNCAPSSESTRSACEDDKFFGSLLDNWCRGLTQKSVSWERYSWHAKWFERHWMKEFLKFQWLLLRRVEFFIHFMIQVSLNPTCYSWWLQTKKQHEIASGSKDRHFSNSTPNPSPLKTDRNLKSDLKRKFVNSETPIHVLAWTFFPTTSYSFCFWSSYPFHTPLECSLTHNMSLSVG